MHIKKINTRDARYQLTGGASADAIHSDPLYYFVDPARVEEGVYQVPQEPGASSDLKEP